jgi:rare lipoprotein A
MKTMRNAARLRWKTAALGPVLLAAAFCVRRAAPPALGLDISAGRHALSGIASWYGDDFQGKPTSNREIYDMYGMTAAHKTLPFETRVRVVNQSNGKSAVVRINDRGPFVDGRIIDLSLAAARAIGMEVPGTAPVRLEILSAPPPAAGPAFAVQVGSFLRPESARALEARLKAPFGTVAIVAFADPAGRTFYRVRLPAADRVDSETLVRRLAEAGYAGLVVEERR